MTRDHRRKKTVRGHAAATGRSYLDAHTALRRSRPDGIPLAAELRDELVAAFRGAGWPVVIEPTPQFHELHIYAGPATVHIARVEDPSPEATGDEHPDDTDVFDLGSALRVTLWAPLTVDYSPELGRVAGVDAHELPVDRSAAEIVAEIDGVIAAARRRDIADSTSSGRCGICEDTFLPSGLLRPTDSPVEVCPCCVFDGDLLDPDPVALAVDIDRLMLRSLVGLAGWAGVQALLCALSGPGLPEWLEDQWRADRYYLPPAESWTGPSQIWVWLPPTDRRPAALSGLGCGASLQHIVATIDQAYPDLRTACRNTHDDEDDEFLRDDDLDENADHRDGADPQNDADHADADQDEVAQDSMRPSDATFARVWPAAVAYAVALLTQDAERPGRRDSWHVLHSFELPDWVDALESDLDHYPVETVLHDAILGIRDALAPLTSDGVQLVSHP